MCQRINYGDCARKRNVTADTALRLAKHFETTPEFWLNLSWPMTRRRRRCSRGRNQGNLIPVDCLQRELGHGPRSLAFFTAAII